MLYWILMIFIGCFILERCLPGWQLPRVKTWPLRVLFLNLIQLGVVLLACWLELGKMAFYMVYFQSF
jgi:hypothetical protein